MEKLTKAYTFEIDNYEILLTPNSYKEVRMQVIKSPKGKPAELSAEMLQDVIRLVFEEFPEDECVKICYGKYNFMRNESPISVYRTLLSGLTF